MKTIRYDLQDGIATITFDEEGSPVNTMCEAWRHELDEVTQRVVRDQAGIHGIVLASAKNTFFAGADLKAAMRLQAGDAARVFQEIE
jgi:3-hydroxyacyl-CoA dehydrogenase/enoyl-CoA hydratase/3-hydroxybutyryl-CoA epimerase